MGTPHPQDIELIDAVIRKDREAFDRFFNTYFSRLFRFCNSRLNDPSACEDVVQETMIKAIRNLHSYRGEASLFTWLCQICRNEMSNYYQRTGRKLERQTSIDDEPGLRAALESLEINHPDQEDTRVVAQLVQLTLDHLPDNYGKVLEWKYLEGLSVTEIAARLRTGEIAVQSLLARARRAFRSGFNELQLEVTP